MIEWTMTITGKCDTMIEVPIGATVESVDGIVCFGVCEVCGKPILDGEKNGCDFEGVMLCEDCMYD